jgi:hypothetical protein
MDVTIAIVAYFVKCNVAFSFRESRLFKQLWARFGQACLMIVAVSAEWRDGVWRNYPWAGLYHGFWFFGRDFSEKQIRTRRERI